MDSLLARSAILMAVVGGIASAQTDSVSNPVADSAKVAAPVVSAPAPVADTAVKAAAISDTTRPIAPATAALPVSDSAKPVVPAAPSQVVDSPTIAPVATRSCGRHGSWVVEAGARYGWIMGDLLDQENRLTKRFNVVLTDENNDTSDVDPIASGVAYRAAAWYKLACGSQFGLGFQYGLLSEHPTSSYASSLSEDFLRQMLLTVRYRYSYKLADQWNLFGEVAGGWNKSTIERAPLVASHLNDGTLRLPSADRVLARDIHSETDLDGIHGEVAVGAGYEIAKGWSLGLSGECDMGQAWLTSKTPAEDELGYPESVSYMGFGLGLFVSYGF